MSFEVFEGDCVSLMAAMPAGSVDSVICDPPYNLSFMGRGWDRIDGETIDPAFGHWLAGFIDGEGCFHIHRKPQGTFDCQFSIALRGDDMPILERCHRQTGLGTLALSKRDGNPQGRWTVSSKAACVALRDLLRAFPLRAKKAHDFELWSDAVDEWVAHERGEWDSMEEIRATLMDSRAYVEGGVRVDPFQMWCWRWGREALRVLKPGGHCLAMGGTRTFHRLTAGLEDAGFEIRDTISWLYGSGFPKSLNVGNGFGTALKPAHEPVVVARKPLSGTVSQTVLEHGTGALNVDGCRVDSEKLVDWNGLTSAEDRRTSYGMRGTGEPTLSAGRWPANVVLSHTEGCVQVGTRKVKSDKDTTRYSALGRMNDDGWEPQEQVRPGYASPDGTETVGAWSCTPGCPVRLLDEQTGERPGFSGGGTKGAGFRADYVNGERVDTELPTQLYGDTGGASRFFPTFTHDKFCALCNLPCVESVGNPSPQSTASSGTAPSDAPASPSQSSGDSSEPSPTSATPADLGSRTTPATARDGSAPTGAQQKLGEWIAHLAGSAEPLCKSCETSTAQSVALWLTDPTQASQAGQGSTLERRRLTLSRNLALIAAGSKQSGITPTTAVLSTSFGSADLATGSATAAPATATNRFAYHPKSSRAERNAGLEGFEERRSGTGALRAEQGGEYLNFVHPVPEGIGAWLREAREAAGLTVKAVAAHFPSRTGGLTGCVSNWEQGYNRRPTPDQWRTLRQVIGFDDRYDEVMTTLQDVPHAVRAEPVAIKRNGHPTVKPIGLMRWLVRLVTPPGGTVLDPFTGSGTTGCASVLEGFDFIGLEREPEYVAIAEARIAWWHKHRGDGEAAQILAAGEARDEVEATGQLGMFD